MFEHGFEHHIPNKLNGNRIHTEFLNFYKNFVKHVSHIPDDSLTCERYSKIQIPYKDKTIIDRLLKNQSFCIMKQDKGRGVVVMNKSKYTEKCLHALQTEQFTKLRHDPTKSIEKKKKYSRN